jgi:RNA polymerase sigma-70 factor (ECF subfamily)
MHFRRLPQSEAPRQIDDPDVSGAVAGDREAFGRLFRRHAPWVQGRLRRMLGARSNLEDLVQEVFLRAYRSLPTYLGQAPFEAWLRRICARVAYDEIRAGSRGVRLEVVTTLPEVVSGPVMEQREAVRHLMHIIETIPPRNRIVLLLHDVEGYTADEIKLVVGAASVNTVRSRLRLARSELHRKARNHAALRWLYGDTTR